MFGPLAGHDWGRGRHDILSAWNNEVSFFSTARLVCLWYYSKCAIFLRIHKSDGRLLDDSCCCPFPKTAICSSPPNN